VEMAAYLPASSASLLKINGVGTVKAARYGKTFLALIQAYAQEHKLVEKQKPRPQRPAPAAPAPAKETISTPRFVVVAEAYNAGKSLEALMTEYEVQLGTILDHLYNYAAQGKSVRAGVDLQNLSKILPEGRKAVSMAFEELGTERLKPVYERLNGGVTYDELKILRLAYLTQKNSA
jgi:ATP-dependent DNA helicase RecQ